MWEKEKQEPLKVKPFNCSDCYYKTKRKHYLKLHIDQIHRTGMARDLSCTRCQKSFKWKASLNLHLKTSLKEPELGTHDHVNDLEDADELEHDDIAECQ